MGVDTTHVGQASLAATAQGDAYAVAASLDARAYSTVSFTLLATVQNLKWTVYGANQSDYSDETVVQAEATVAAAAVGTFTVSPAPFGYYRVKVKNAAAGVVGTATVQGFAKP